MSRQHTIRIGVIGAGRIGKIHAETIATRIPEAQLVAVADIDEAAAHDLGQQLQVQLVATDPQRVIADGGIDAVAICSSTDTHAQLIKDAAAAGKHIFTEKPIDLSLEKIDEALDAVEKAGVKMQVGFNRRFDPNFAKIRELVAAGKIGDLHILRITSRDPAPPPLSYVRVSGGLFVDMAIHDFDMARFLSGSEIEEVYTAAAVRVDPAIGEAGDVDTAVITLRFANGALGTIDNSRQAVYGYDQRVEVFGSEGMATVANNTPNSHVYSSATGVYSEKPLYFFLERYMESYIAEMKVFVQALCEDREPPVTGIDGRIPVLVGMAAKRSYVENRPVRIDELA